MLNSTITSTLERVDQNKGFLRDRLLELNNKINELEDTFNSLPSKGTAYSKNQRQYKVHESYYLNMMQKKAELGIEEAGTIPEFQVLSSANIPSVSISPDKFIIYGIGIGIGLFLSIALVVIRYLLHNTINTVRDLEKLTSAPVLGSIPYYTKEKMVVSRLIVDRNPKSAISEALRSIRTNMEFMVPGKKKKIISVTSTVSGEGKTFVAVNLGGVIALSQLKVVLVDLDMRKPKVNLAFGHENLEGMSTILIGKHHIDDCIRKTSLKNLDYISAGPTPPNPSELILSAEFDQVITYLHSIYDVIILDTPPVGLVTDGVLVMKKADLPIYIVRSDYSRRDFMKTLNKLTKENKFTKTSVILNSVKYSKNYYYNYGYGNGYYEDPVSDSRRFPKIKELISSKK
jgi:capsular exopolysaccharide synthesis family protein